MKKTKLFLACLFSSGLAWSQNKTDSIKTTGIQEVIVIKTNQLSKKEAKPLGSLDDYLQKSDRVDMIRRGAYAWEPTLNNMNTERTLVTIDGMRIFGACTDKMDPITSYVEVTNLSAAKIKSGQQGACHGTTIGGAIDLERTKNYFGDKTWKFNINTGYESVNQQKIVGGSIRFKNTKIYNDLNFMWRNAENYKAGNNTEIPFSQYKKLNFSETLGFKINEKNIIEGSVIYDKATDVGYPALPMDVSLAEAIISSFQYKYQNNDGFIKNWETKIYYNNITHRMDDTKRPSVPIHMDMPGWSTTFGYYSKVQFNINHHQILFNLKGFQNKSLADMTMYPNNSNEKLMYMLTWPGVKTINQGLYIEDKMEWNDIHSVKISGGISIHQNTIDNKMGLESLQIFYPNLDSTQNRFLKSIAVNYDLKKEEIEAGIGIGFGDRAPSVSEGYGFYLFNATEKYDYIGNPNLKNEKSWEINSYFKWKKNSDFYISLNASFFNLQNFMVGEIIPGLVPMTIGASGVKKMTALEQAKILNIGLNTEYKINRELKWEGQISYNYGKDNHGDMLPYISPIKYRTAFMFEKNAYTAELGLIGNSIKNKFNPRYGESRMASFAIINLNIGYLFTLGNNKIALKTGIENLLDTYYNTYSDWNKIPRTGRNIFVHISYSF